MRERGDHLTELGHLGLLKQKYLILPFRLLKQPTLTIEPFVIKIRKDQKQKYAYRIDR